MDELLSIREVASRLLARRPDLSSQRPQRRRARQIADGVAMRAAPVDVLAGWLGNNADADVRDLQQALQDRIGLRLASLSPVDREAADTPDFRARVALDLGWEQLQGHGPKEVLRVLAIAGGVELHRELVADAAAVGGETLSDVIWSGFAQADDQGYLRAHASVLDHLKGRKDHPGAAEARPRRFVVAVRRHLAMCDPGETRVDPAAERAVDIAERAQQGGLVASLCHRQATRLQHRSDLDGSRAWLQRGVVAASRPSGLGLLGLLELDLGLLSLRSSDAPDALAAFGRAIEALEHAEQDGVLGAEEALERARLAHAETLAAMGQISRAEAELQDLVRALQRRVNELPPPAPDEEPDYLQEARERSLRAALAHAFRALGSLLLLRGDVSGALIRLREGWDDWVELAGEDHADGAPFALALAAGLRAAGRFHEVDEPLEIARMLAGGDMDRPARGPLPLPLHDLGVAAGDRKDHQAAATLLDEATMMAGSLLEKQHPLRSRIMYTRALLYLADGDLSRAADMLDDAAAFQLDDADAAIVASAQAWLIAREGAHRYVEAAERLQTAEDALTEARGSSSRAAAHVRLLRRSLRG